MREETCYYVEWYPDIYDDRWSTAIFHCRKDGKEYEKKVVGDCKIYKKIKDFFDRDIKELCDAGIIVFKKNRTNYLEAGYYPMASKKENTNTSISKPSYNYNLPKDKERIITPFIFRSESYQELQKKAKRRKWIIIITYIAIGSAVIIFGCSLIRKNKYKRSDALFRLDQTKKNERIDTSIEHKSGRVMSIIDNINNNVKVTKEDIDELNDFFEKIAITNTDDNQSYYGVGFTPFFHFDNQMQKDVFNYAESLYNEIFDKNGTSVSFNEEKAYHFILFVSNLINGGDTNLSPDDSFICQLRNYLAFLPEGRTIEDGKKRAQSLFESLMNNGKYSVNRIKYSGTRAEAKCYNTMSPYIKRFLLSQLREVASKIDLERKFYNNSNDTLVWWEVSCSRKNESFLGLIGKKIEDVDAEQYEQYCNEKVK